MSKLNALLSEIYGNTSEQIISEIQSYIKVKKAEKSSRDWYKTMNLYVAYPESFCKDNKCGLNQLIEKIPYIKKLGINALHVLPPYESPMIDAGFDISDFKKIRKELGGNKAFDKLIEVCKKNNIKLFLDMIFNHISNEHSWFRKAVSGDQKYRDYFEYYEEKPKFIKRFKNDSGNWAKYKFKGKEVDIRIIFPEFCGKIPHFIQAKDRNWYYHTFYPHQIDLNWRNPDVFVEYAKILIFWAKKGLSFRLDAITFMGKNIENGNVESNEVLHKIITALHMIMKMANKDSVFLVETCQPLDTIKKYFKHKRNREAELAYSFPFMNELWKAIILNDATDIPKAIDSLFKKIPYYASWINFLRNHDELSMEFASPKDRTLICNKIQSKGVGFRNGYDIAGRTASFLDGDKKRIINAYCLLASMPGAIQIIYGDEIGKENDFEFMKTMVKIKQKRTNDTSISDDTRDINRGRIQDVDTARVKAKEIYKTLSQIFNTRIRYRNYFQKPPSSFQNINKNIYFSTYKKGIKKLHIIINLSDKEQAIPLETKLNPVLASKGSLLEDKKLHLEEYGYMWLT